MSATSRALRPTAGVLRSRWILQRADHFAQHLGGHLGVARGGIQALVAEQHLDGTDIDLAFQQMGGEAVPPISLETLEALSTVPDYVS
jgi:hypothetical protein